MKRTALLLLAALPACALFQGPPPPDLTPRYRAIRSITDRVGQIRGIMNADLGDLESLPRDFFALPRNTYAPPFPVDLFKQTAMSCLNEPVTDTPGEPTGGEEARETLRTKYNVRVTCAPAELPYCLKALEQRAPNAITQALAQLERVDRLRLLHARLKERATNMPLIIRQQRELLAKQRAEWRQVDRDLKRQRAEFTPENWTKTQKRLQTYQSTIDDLASAIDALEDQSNQWTARIQETLDAFYLDLAGLYDREPGTLGNDPSRERPLPPKTP